MELAGKVQTVLGVKLPEELGITLPHEHLLLDFTKALRNPEYVTDCMGDLQFTMRNLGRIRQFPYSVKDNLVIDKVEEVVEELKLFKASGGGTVVDLTPIGIRTSRDLLPRIARESGVNIVAGTGYYVEAFQSEAEKAMTTEAMAEFMIQEITCGAEGSGMKCGVIGEIGCSWPLADCERKALNAGALTQQKTGAPINVHLGRDQQSAFEVLDILQSAGADLSRTVLSHVDRTIFDDDKLLQLARRGCYLEFDLFGIECSHYQFNTAVDMPSDAQRIQKVKLLVDNGFSNQVLLSHDLHTKHRLVQYGGHGYRHLLDHIAPKMVDRGISRDIVVKMMTENPQKCLAFV